jgi:hypothetical protein
MMCSRIYIYFFEKSCAHSKLGKPNSFEELHEDILYSGEENPFNLHTYYAMTFGCEFDLSMFPFDTQSCDIRIKGTDDQKRYLQLEWANVTAVERLSTIQFKFEGISQHIEFDNTEIIVTITLERTVSYYLATTYLPTVCLVAIAEMTLLIDRSHFEVEIPIFLKIRKNFIAGT